MLDIDTELSSVKTIAHAWAQGDTVTMERLSLGAMRESPDSTSGCWSSAIELGGAGRGLSQREERPAFVVVGAAHLIGPHSLVALLQQKGHVVEQR